jgi:AsmA protein
VRILKWAGGLVLLLVVALVLFIAFGLNTLRGPITRAVTNATGRELRIEGDLKPLWSWLYPRFRAEKVSFANPDWASEDYLFRADALEASIALLPLLRGRVVVPKMHLQRPEVFLERDAEGRKNWLLDREPDGSRASRVHILALTLDQGRLKYDDAIRDTHIAAQLAGDAHGIGFAAKGKYRGLPATASGRGGPVLAVRSDKAPYPLKAEARIGSTSLTADGTITDLAELSGLNLMIQLGGESMEQLYDLVGIAFPDTSRYSTSGRLIGAGSTLRYEKFTGRVGESDLAGTLQVDTGGKRPFMRGELVSQLLNLADLGPLVGTRQPKQGGVLPDAAFDAARWNSVDADVTLKAGTLKRPEELPLENLSTRIQMRDAVLTLDPLEFGTAGGRLAGPIRLDGREAPIRADARIRVQDLQLSKLFPTVEVSRASVGAVSGLIELTGAGNSVAKMIGSANGKVGVYVDSGQVSKMVMEMVALDFWNLAKVVLRGDEPVEIRCAIADFDVKDGLMRTNALVLDTSVMSITGEGTINLRDETISLKIAPHPKAASLASLRSPLYIAGTFSQPKVSRDARRIAEKGAGALVLGILNPLLAVLPLIYEGKGQDSNCGKLIAQATSSSRPSPSGEPEQHPPAQSAR